MHIQSSSVNKKGDVLEVVEEYPNLAPVHDFCVADLDKQVSVQVFMEENFALLNIYECRVKVNLSHAPDLETTLHHASSAMVLG